MLKNFFKTTFGNARKNKDYNTTDYITREVSVKKVLGENVTGITTLLSKDFLRLVFTSQIIAPSVALLMISDWLQHYKYRIEISWWNFLATGISAILLALITISFQSVKAAIANPVKGLRTK
ncbi:MAG TPA: hypothetical protein VHB70_02800 [Parafilimonas sp.]|nr:hypothetical protein [Parafilimonas sp.]